MRDCRPISGRGTGTSWATNCAELPRVFRLASVRDGECTHCLDRGPASGTPVPRWDRSCSSRTGRQIWRCHKACRSGQFTVEGLAPLDIRAALRVVLLYQVDRAGIAQAPPNGELYNIV